MNNGSALDRDDALNRNIPSLQEMAMAQVITNISKCDVAALNDIIARKSVYERVSNCDDTIQSVMAKMPIQDRYFSHKIEGWVSGFKNVRLDPMGKRCIFSHYEAHRLGLLVCDFDEGTIVARNDARPYYDSIKYSPSGNVMMCRRWSGRYDLLSHDLKAISTNMIDEKNCSLNFCVSDDKFVFRYDKNGKRVESVVDTQGNILMEADQLQFSSNGRVMLKTEDKECVLYKGGKIIATYSDVLYGKLSEDGKRLFLQDINGECTVIDFCSKIEQKLDFMNLNNQCYDVRFSINDSYLLLHDVANNRDIIINIDMRLAVDFPYAAKANFVLDDEYIHISSQDCWGRMIKVADLFREENEDKTFSWCVLNDLVEKFCGGSVYFSKVGKKIVFIDHELKSCSFKERTENGDQELTFEDVTMLRLSSCGNILLLFKDDKTCEVVRPCDNLRSYALKCLMEKK